MNGEWQDAGEGCPVLCEDGACAACEPDEAQCNGLQPQVCDTNGEWVNAGSACPFVCDSETGACGGVCTPGAKQCDGLQPQLCDDSGTWADEGDACPSVCNGGTCTACEPGEAQCNGAQPQVCSDDGKWQDEGDVCPYVCDETSASCTGTCKPGTKQCDELQPQLCDTSGTWEDTGSACPFTCNTSSGTCAGTCVPGAQQCAGNEPQVCNESGAWEASGTSCGTCNPCSAATGTCALALRDTPCESNKYCDGAGTCRCRAKSSWNLLTNPGFDGNANGWTLNSTASYTTADVDGCSGSGSLNIDALNDTFRQCLPAVGEQTYHFGYRFKGTGSLATCVIIFLPAGNSCQIGDGIGSAVAEATDNDDTWNLFFGSAESPEGVTHIIFNCSAPGATGNFDQLYLSTESPSSPLF